MLVPFVVFSVQLWLTSADPNLDGQAIAALMNQEYHSYNPSDNASGIGVYLRLSEDATIYCHVPCFQGKPDCKISGSVFNDKQMIDPNTGRIANQFGKATAWYINTTKVRSTLAKCSFAWDGGTDGKVNGGCGCNPGTGTDCNNHNTAYWNMCGGSPCTDKSPGVVQCECDNISQSKWPESAGRSPYCFWKGPAFYPPSGTAPDETHTMLNQRVKYQGKSGGTNLWNEMVLDGDQLLKEMAQDSMATMPAIVYFPSVHGEAYGRQMAERLVQELKDKYKQPRAIPIIRVDDTVDVTKGGNPFQYVPAVELDRLVV